LTREKFDGRDVLWLVFRKLFSIVVRDCDQDICEPQSSLLAAVSLVNGRSLGGEPSDPLPARDGEDRPSSTIVGRK